MNKKDKQIMIQTINRLLDIFDEEFNYYLRAAAYTGSESGYLTCNHFLEFSDKIRNNVKNNIKDKK